MTRLRLRNLLHRALLVGVLALAGCTAADEPALRSYRDGLRAERGRRGEVAAFLSAMPAAERTLAHGRLEELRRSDPAWNLALARTAVEKAAPGTHFNPIGPAAENGVLLNGRGGAKEAVSALERMTAAMPSARVFSATVGAESWEAVLQLRGLEAVRSFAPKEIVDAARSGRTMESTKRKALRAEIAALSLELAGLERVIGTDAPLAAPGGIEPPTTGDRTLYAIPVVRDMMSPVSPMEAPLVKATFVFRENRCLFEGTLAKGSHLGMVAIGAGAWYIGTIDGQAIPTVKGELEWRGP